MSTDDHAPEATPADEQADAVATRDLSSQPTDQLDPQALADTAVADPIGAPQPGDELFRTGTVSEAEAMNARYEEPSAFTPPAAGEMIGQYELIRELGRGGMGAVFLARDTRLGRLVAIKFLGAYNDALAELFLAEARTTARCKHQNIVVIHDVDTHDGQPYMVLEYLEGPTLRTWLEQTRASDGSWRGDASRELVSPSLAVELMVPVVRALICAHDAGIVHRDLKPENIILAESEPIKVLDFGIAKLVADEHIATAATAPDQLDVSASVTNPGAIMGTLPYMSPEQWGADEVDQRTDIWAVGVMLYEMVTGRNPLAPLSRQKLMSVADVDVPMPRVSEEQPDLGALGPIIDRCLLKRKADRTGSARALLDELEPLLPSHRARDLSEDANPFAGLAAFQESDANRFFGRDQDIARMVEQLRNRRLVAVVGPSGTGKSSFIRAGVIPALKRSGIGWEAFTIRPGRHPLDALVGVLDHISATDSSIASSLDGEPLDSQSLSQALRTQPGFLGTRLRARARQKVRRVLLFVDQFEELYTLGADPDERAAFAACLEGVADDAASPLRVVLSLRADFLDRVAHDRGLMAEVIRGMVFLPPIGRGGLREALVRPVEATGYRFETDEMVDAMLDTLDATRGPLPVLQFAAARLWEARDRDRRLITQASHDELGGVAGALSTHADAVLAGLSADEQRLARAVFLRLVTPERTRAVVTMSELCELTDDGAATEQVIHHLASARLLLIEAGHDGEDADAGHTSVEIVHESLIAKWPKLGRWLNDNKDDAEFLARLRSAAKQWDSGGRAEGFLWRGQAADEAERWFKRWRTEGGELGKRDELYLRAVVALAQRSRRRRGYLVVAALIALSAVAVVVSFLAITARQEAARADREAARVRDQAVEIERRARRAQQEATRARNVTRMAVARELKDDPTTALALLREIEPPEEPRGWSTLAHWALQTGVARVVLTHPSRVKDAVFSPDGTRIVTTSVDGAVRIYSAEGTGAPVVLRGHGRSVVDVAFSPDGTRIVTASIDRTARVWNADGTGEPVILRGHTGRVSGAAFSPDGARIVTSSFDHTVRIWNADGTGNPVILRGHDERVASAAFSPDGARLLTASFDKTAWVWSLDGMTPPIILTGHTDWVYSAVFSPDGARIVTASQDRTARVYRADGTGRAVVLSGHGDAVYSAAFSPDGTRVVTASSDNTARLYRADGSGEPVVFRGHQAWVNSATFSHDGGQIVTASQDKTVRVYDIHGPGLTVVLNGHDDRISSAAFSPDGRRVVTASRDNTAHIYSVDGGAPVRVLRGHGDRVAWAAFSPDGSQIVTASLDNTVRLWNADKRGRPRVLRGHRDRVYSAAFSPDGTRVVTASKDETARIWTVRGPGRTVVLRGHGDLVYSAAFSQDGARVVTASFDRTARIWNADGTGEPIVLTGHGKGVTSAAFSPDDQRIVTGSLDNTARIWNVDGSGSPVVLRGHIDRVFSVGFSPDGARVVTASADNTASVWNADGSGQPLVLSGHESSVNSAQFSPDGTWVVTASNDTTVRIWRDLRAVHLGDPRLWSATTYCLSIERRQRLLDTSDDMARANRRQCLDRVRGARVRDAP